jgi:hypothetical protein
VKAMLYVTSYRGYEIYNYADRLIVFPAGAQVSEYSGTGLNDVYRWIRQQEE